MADPKILIRRSSTPGSIPTIAQLELGELVINTYDGILFFKKDVAGVQTIVQVGVGGGGGGGALTEIDGGDALTVFTAGSLIDGGDALTVFTAGLFMSVDGGNA